MIADNPFRRLKLPATASPREVRRSLEEAKIDLALDPDEDALIELSRLRQQLEDPVLRVRHEVFWVHGDAVVVDVTDASAVQAVTGALREAANGPPSREQAIALHDLAVLTYAHYLTRSDATDPSEILALWADVAGSSEFWRHLEQRALDAHDARITAELVEEIRAEIADAILTPLADKAAALIDIGDLDGAAVLVHAMRDCALSPAAVDAAANRSVVALRASVDDGVTVVDRMIDELDFDSGENWALRKAVTATEDELVTRVLAPLARLHAVDAQFVDPALADRAAFVVRSLAIDVCKPPLEAWEWGYVLMRYALTEARSSTLVARLAVEQAEVAMSYHRATATEAAKDGYAVETAAHNELALMYARNDAERTAWRNLASGARSQHEITDEQLADHKRAISARLDRHCERLHERAQLAAGIAPPPAPPVPAPVAAPSPPRLSTARIVVALIVLLVLLALAASAFAAPPGVAAASIAVLPPLRRGADLK